MSLTLHFSASYPVTMETALLLESTPTLRFLALGSAYRSQQILDAVSRLPYLEELRLEHWSNRREHGRPSFAITSPAFPSLRALAAESDIVQLIVTMVTRLKPLDLITIKEALHLDLMQGILSISDTYGRTDLSPPPLDIHIHQYTCLCSPVSAALANPQ